MSSAAWRGNKRAKKRNRSVGFIDRLAVEGAGRLGDILHADETPLTLGADVRRVPRVCLFNGSRSRCSLVLSLLLLLSLVPLVLYYQRQYGRRISSDDVLG